MIEMTIQDLELDTKFLLKDGLNFQILKMQWMHQRLNS